MGLLLYPKLEDKDMNKKTLLVVGAFFMVNCHEVDSGACDDVSHHEESDAMPDSAGDAAIVSPDAVMPPQDAAMQTDASGDSSSDASECLPVACDTTHGCGSSCYECASSGVCRINPLLPECMNAPPLCGDGGIIPCSSVLMHHNDAGTCVCNDGLSTCGNACANLSVDTQNCGTCGNVCNPGFTCNMGVCFCSGYSNNSECVPYCPVNTWMPWNTQCRCPNGYTFAVMSDMNYAPIACVPF